jgi:DNA-binding response OmpR family regulator
MTISLATFSRRRVLLIEDDPSVVALATHALDELHFDVVVERDYRTAIQRIKESPPFMVVLDLNLPRDSGYDVCEVIRKDPMLTWVQIIIMSNRRSPEDQAYAEEAGANAYLKKPFTAAMLQRYVTALLDGPVSSRPTIRRLLRTDPPPGHYTLPRSRPPGS